MVRAPAAPAGAAAARVQWRLTLGSQAITTRFLSVTVEGESTELLPLQPPTVRIEVRAGGQVISQPVAASYGFDETRRDVQLRVTSNEPPIVEKNTIMLQVGDVPDVTEVTIHLVDATGVSLARREHVPLRIAL